MGRAKLRKPKPDPWARFDAMLDRFVDEAIEQLGRPTPPRLVDEILERPEP